MKKLSCDYLLVGCGATGMAFLDELVLGNKNNLEVIVVDRRSKPGGHWFDAYEFVRLHQPALTYGVNSRDLGAGGCDLASKAQILACYELVMGDLLATGRVKYFPLCEYKWDGRFVSLVEEGLEYQVEVRKKIVNATLLETQVPSTRAPKYEVTDDVTLIPINGLSRLNKPWAKYVVIGAGKTGLDALLYLLDQNISAEKIQWIVSNDCWYWSRDFSIGHASAEDMIRGQVEGVMKSNNLKECYKNYEEMKVFLRFDKNVEPTKMRAATVNTLELERLRKIKDVVRKGRVSKITKDKMIFENGADIATVPDSLYIDCTAPGTLFPQTQPIFPDKRTICLQMVRLPAPTYSGSVIAAIELLYSDDLEKMNEICTPIAAPHELEDWFRGYRINLQNEKKIGGILGMSWMRARRLSGMNMFGAWVMIKVVFTMMWYQDSVIERLGEILQ